MQKPKKGAGFMTEIIRCMICGAPVDEMTSEFNLTVELAHYPRTTAKYDKKFILCPDHKKLFYDYIDAAGNAFYNQYCRP